MEKIILSEVAKWLGTECPEEKIINEISSDTRTINKDCLFVAIKGERFDGHDFVKYAIESGAAAAVTEYPVEGCPCLVVENTRKAFLKIAECYRKKMSPILVGITGSVGKTTTKEMISLVLSEKYKTLKTQGNLNNEIGLPKTLFNLDSTYEAAVIEMGMNHFGEIERLSKTASPTIGVITNIGFSHIENLKSQEGILKAKLEILEGMNDDAPLIVCGDDEFLSTLKVKLGKNRPIYFYGTAENCDFKISDIKEDDEISYFSIKYDGKITNLKIPCVGQHNILNAAAAFSIGKLCGLSDNEIANALLKYKSDGLRQNIVEKNGCTVIIDCYNASPDSMKASLKVLSGIKSEGRKIAVLGDMLELGELSEKLHRLVGKYVAEYCPDMLYCYGENAMYIASEASDRGIAASAFHSDSKMLMAKKIKDYLKSGDTILFKASRGMKLEEVIDNVFE